LLAVGRLLQQRTLDHLGISMRQRALPLAIASLLLGRGQGHAVTLPQPNPDRQQLRRATAGLDIVGEFGPTQRGKPRPRESLYPLFALGSDRKARASRGAFQGAPFRRRLISAAS